MNDAEFSRKTGVGVQTLKRYETGSSPSIEIAARIADAFDVSLDWLCAREGQWQAQSQIMVSLAEVPPSEFITVPRYDVQASAGAGAINFHEMPSSVIAFDRVFLRDLGAVPEQCLIVEAKGDSMQPTIPDGSLLVVDQSQRQVDHGCIYVFRVGNRLLVKRARWRMDGKLELTSDNLLGGYPIEVFGPSDIDDIDVAGRVVYFSRVP